MDLYPYQREAVARIAAGNTYLAFEMGLGKTRVALAVAQRIRARRVLVICPAVGRLVWAQEIAKVWPDAPPVVMIKSFADLPRLKGECIALLSYGLVSQSKSGGYDYIEGIKKAVDGRPFDLTVLDEAHALKNPAAIRTKGVLQKMKPFLGRVLPMSGTPAPNHAGELFPILKSLFPDAVKNPDGSPMNQWQFENAFCDIVMKNFGGRQIRTIEGSKNTDKLRARMAPYFLRKRKKDVLQDLPEMTFDTLPVAVSAANQKALAEFDDIIPPGTSDSDLDAKLRKGGEHVMRMRHVLGVAKVQGSVEVIQEALEDSERKLVVFAHHQDVIDLLMRNLSEHSPVKIDGRDNQSQRDRAVTAFLDQPLTRVFVGQLSAAGTSITLCGPNNDVSDVYFVEADWSPGINVQAASRIHRIGQRNAVQVWFLTAHGTLDDRIQGLLSRKTADFNALFS
jgi:SWI/SNF-related matrix-associated actin-dependent regulator of chromatin subfamily A-like protein 1